MTNKECPCGIDCAERSVLFCPVCEKGKLYKAGKLKQYEEKAKAFSFGDYLGSKVTKSFRDRSNFLKGNIR